MVVLPRVTLLFFFFSPFAKLAVTARAWSSLHSSFIVRLECGRFFLFCAETLQSVFTWGKDPALPHLGSIHTPNLCNAFYLRHETLVASHTHPGTKEMGSWQKAEEAKQGFREEEKGLREEEEEWPQRQKAVSCHPSWSQGLLPSWSSSWPVCSSCGTALADHPQACKPSCFQHCQWSWWAHSCCPQCFIVSCSGGCSPMTDRHREKNTCLNISTFR